MSPHPLAAVWRLCREWDRRENAMTSRKPKALPDSPKEER